VIVHDFRRALDPAVLFEDALGFAPLDWQRTYLRAGGNVVLNKSRQIGASTANAIIAIAATLYEPGANAVIVSPSLQQSKEIGPPRRGPRCATSASGLSRTRRRSFGCAAGAGSSASPEPREASGAGRHGS
jgi:hypothetical protein